MVHQKMKIQSVTHGIVIYLLLWENCFILLIYLKRFLIKFIDILVLEFLEKIVFKYL